MSRSSKYIIQSILIPTTYSPTDAIEWIITHGYTVKKIHTTESYHHFRQHTTEYVYKRGCKSLKTISIGQHGIKMVIAYCK